MPRLGALGGGRFEGDLLRDLERWRDLDRCSAFTWRYDACRSLDRLRDLERRRDLEHRRGLEPRLGDFDALLDFERERLRDLPRLRDLLMDCRLRLS